MNRVHILGLLAAIGAAGATQAANFSRGAYDGAKADIRAAYKAEREACSKHEGNARDVCIEQAKGREAVALAQLEFNYSGAAKDEIQLREAQVKAAYELAKERCDDHQGDSKDLCLREAKTARDKGLADTKLAKRVTDAVDDAEAARRKADYKLAMQKCDLQVGELQAACIASTKARYGERW